MSILTLRPAFATFRPSRSAAKATAAFARPVEVLRTLREIDAIADDWRALEAETPEATGFQSFDWCRAWMAAAGGDDADRWRIVVVRDGGRIAAVWPLERGRLFGARVLGWLGEPWTQYGDALVADDARRFAHLAAAWREITAWRDVDAIKLGRVRDDAALHALPGFRGCTAIHIEHAPFLDLMQTPPRPDKRLRARRKKLEAVGPVRFDLVTDEADRRACVRLAIEWKREWLRARGLASTGFSHPYLDSLMDGLAVRPTVSGTWAAKADDTLVIGRLRVGDDVAALELGLQANGAFRSLLGAHDTRFAFGSPGHLLIDSVIARFRGTGFVTYDLMVPADEYKRRWSNAEVAVRDHLLPTRLRGRPAAAWFRSRPAIKRSYAKLPQWARRLAAPSI